MALLNLKLFLLSSQYLLKYFVARWKVQKSMKATNLHKPEDLIEIKVVNILKLN